MTRIAFKISRVVYYLDDPANREEYFVDAWSSFVRKNPTYMTHTLVDVNEMMSDIISILHLSLNMPDMPSAEMIGSPKSWSDASLSPCKRSKAR